MKNPATFEEAVSRLEAIVAKMESGGEDLDKTVASFEEGRKLVAFCNEKLAAIERKVEILSRAPDGSLKTGPFAEEPGAAE
ncbi:MAG: exodeoxyribonuclease VII small subunit [Kiritimatiellae bacterium]|nr:exodeoxyribonuclease VII small subunit [Kiritimatiellia bacterium]MBR1836783.1 exodeoxyribonuclease VII small subunit [Kiritimatiellia bacterium]